MQRSSDKVKLRALLCLQNFLDRGISVSEMARCLGEENYTISRVFMVLEKEGILVSGKNRRRVVTELGKKHINRYNQKVEALINQMVQAGISVEEAKDNALFIAGNCSDRVIDVVEKVQKKYKAKAYFKGRDSFYGNELARVIGNGSFPAPFYLYPVDNEGLLCLDQVNLLFEHPCNIIVNKGVGNINIRISEGNSDPELEELRYCLKNSRAKIFNHGYFNVIEQNASVICIPMEAINFQSFGEGFRQSIHGTTICTLLKSSEGKETEVKYTFTIII